MRPCCGRLTLYVELRSVEPEGWTRSPRPAAEISVWTNLDAPTSEELDVVKRELEREAGHFAWEPEP